MKQYAVIVEPKLKYRAAYVVRIHVVYARTKAAAIKEADCKHGMEYRLPYAREITDGSVLRV